MKADGNGDEQQQRRGEARAQGGAIGYFHRTTASQGIPEKSESTPNRDYLLKSGLHLFHSADEAVS